MKIVLKFGDVEISLACLRTLWMETFERLGIPNVFHGALGTPKGMNLNAISLYIVQISGINFGILAISVTAYGWHFVCSSRDGFARCINSHVQPHVALVLLLHSCMDHAILSGNLGSLSMGKLLYRTRLILLTKCHRIPSAFPMACPETLWCF